MIALTAAVEPNRGGKYEISRGARLVALRRGKSHVKFFCNFKRVAA